MFINITNQLSKDFLVFRKILEIHWFLSGNLVHSLLKDLQILLRGNQSIEGHIFIDDDIALIQRDWLV